MDVGLIVGLVVNFGLFFVYFPGTFEQERVMTARLQRVRFGRSRELVVVESTFLLFFFIFFIFPVMGRIYKPSSVSECF